MNLLLVTHELWIVGYANWQDKISKTPIFRLELIMHLMESRCQVVRMHCGFFSASSRDSQAEEGSNFLSQACTKVVVLNPTRAGIDVDLRFDCCLKLIERIRRGRGNRFVRIGGM
jgi:hypothetical protein